MLQSKTPAQHMADTSHDLLRDTVLLVVLNDPSYQGPAMAERFLQMYLNECRTEKSREWYTLVQSLFLEHHPDWVNSFDTVLAERRRDGGKAQKTNVMGDWLALSQLRGQPLGFEMLSFNKRADPRVAPSALSPTDDIVITVNSPKEGVYRQAFDLLYHKHCHEHNGWKSMLRRMDIKSMTGDLWDAFVEVYPQELALPFRGVVLRGYEWKSTIQQLLPMRYGLEFSRELVRLMQNGKADELYQQFEDDSYAFNNVLRTPEMSEALYETLNTHPDVRTKLSTVHLVHALNADPGRALAELNYAVGGKSNAHASRDIVVSPFLEQLSTKANESLFSALFKEPQKYLSVIEKFVENFNANDEDKGSIFSLEAMQALVASTWVKVFLVESILDGKATMFLSQFAKMNSHIEAELTAANFEEPHAFETIMMRHITPTLTYSDAR